LSETSIEFTVGIWSSVPRPDLADLGDPWSSTIVASLATPPDYLLRPQYQTRDITAFLKGMQAHLDEQHRTLKQAHLDDLP
jgi:hypothetical protein